MRDWEITWSQLKWQIVIGFTVSTLIGWVVFMAADNGPPYTFDVEKSYIAPSKATDGDQITVVWKIKRLNKVCPGSNIRTLFDPKTGVVLATYDATPAALSPSIKDGYLNRTFQLPRSILPPGIIGYRATVCYECNIYQSLVKPLCITTPDLFFEIKD